MLYHKDFVERMRNQYPPGTRVEVISLCNEEEHLKPGSLQMIERPLMMTDELKTMPKGQFIVMKTGAHPMKVKLKLFFKWGITFGEPYTVLDKGNRPVAYAGKKALVQAIREKYPPPPRREEEPPEIQEIPLEQVDPQKHLPQAGQGEQPAAKVHASAPARRKTPPGKERKDDRP